MATSTETTVDTSSPFKRFSEEEIEEIGREFQAIHDEVFDSLGERDAKYITSIIALQRRLAALGRAILLASRWRAAQVAGTATLSLAKILENMEIGHNVLHGQWDWMNHPEINSSNWDWDTASTSEAWKHSHNFIHHTYTNVIGKDRDLGYEIMRIDPAQPWHPFYLLQPLYNILLMAFFEWGVAVHDLDFTAIRAGQKDMKRVRRELKGIAGKARTQIVKDYIAWPLVSGVVSLLVDAGVTSARRARTNRRARLANVARRANPISKPKNGGAVVRELVERRSFRAPFRNTFWADFAANVIRNFWAHAIIFCGHFPDGTYTFTEEEYDHETKGGWYMRQLHGAANIDGGPLFHVLSGNLGFQIEHHLYPDMPSSRYQEIAPRVREVCERHQLQYNTGPLRKQWGSVMRTIARLALPGGKERPKPGPYRPSENGSAREA
jgi:NADPH-dependent stearoyl-CoA 9-desaturase